MSRKRSRNADREGKVQPEAPDFDAPLSDLGELDQAIAEDEAHAAAQVERKRKGIAVVAGKDGPKTAPPAPEDVLRADLPLQGLTPQQEQFAQLVAGGVNKTEAYRRAYNVGPDTKPESITRQAVAVAQNLKVASRIAQLNQAQTRATVHSASEIRAKCVSGLIETLEGTSTPQAKLKAIELLGKMPGVDLFRDTLVTQADTRTAQEVEQELLAKIKAIIGADPEDDVSP
jgi:hypothetical protein